MLIASRELTLRDGDSEIKIPVRLFAPQREADGAWKCRYEIGWPDEMIKKEIFGAAFDAGDGSGAADDRF